MITNDIFTGRVNMILGVMINGDYLRLMTWRTVNSEDYCLYLTLLSKSLKGTENGIYNDVTVIQDNASIHRINIVKTTASREKFTMYLLPHYSPDLAPVELMFGAVKRKIKGEILRQGCRFSSECGKRCYNKGMSINWTGINYQDVDDYDQTGKEIYFKWSETFEIGRIVSDEKRN